jgi:hypothetical protein
MGWPKMQNESQKMKFPILQIHAERLSVKVDKMVKKYRNMLHLPRTGP